MRGLLVVVGFLAACTPDSDLTNAELIWRVPASLTFGEVDAGSTARLGLVVESTGSAALRLTAVSSSEPTVGYDASLPFVVAPRGRRELWLTWSPTQPGELQATLELEADGDELSKRVVLTGIAVLPDCDDGEACTDDAWSGSNCTHTVREGACDDGSACTTDDVCVAGVCSGLALGCDDGVGCTIDACDPLVGCVTIPNDAACDDGVLCTTDTCTPTGCSSPVAQDGEACGAPSCDSLSLCVGGRCESLPLPDDVTLCDESSVCDDANPCTRDYYHFEEHRCVFTWADEDASCEAGCTAGTCQSGQCVGGPRDCNDGVACTVDACDAVLGCRHTPSDALCPGTVCQTTTCDAAAGCTSVPTFDGSYCGAVDCSGGVSCQGGACLPGGPFVDDVCQGDALILDVPVHPLSIAVTVLGEPAPTGSMRFTSDDARVIAQQRACGNITWLDHYCYFLDEPEAIPVGAFEADDYEAVAQITDVQMGDVLVASWPAAAPSFDVTGPTDLVYDMPTTPVTGQLTVTGACDGCVSLRIGHPASPMALWEFDDFDEQHPGYYHRFWGVYGAMAAGGAMDVTTHLIAPDTLELNGRLLADGPMLVGVRGPTWRYVFAEPIDTQQPVTFNRGIELATMDIVVRENGVPRACDNADTVVLEGDQARVFAEASCQGGVTPSLTFKAHGPVGAYRVRWAPADSTLPGLVLDLGQVTLGSASQKTFDQPMVLWGGHLSTALSDCSPQGPVVNRVGAIHAVRAPVDCTATPPTFGPIRLPAGRYTIDGIVESAPVSLFADRLDDTWTLSPPPNPDSPWVSLPIQGTVTFTPDLPCSDTCHFYMHTPSGLWDTTTEVTCSSPTLATFDVMFGWYSDRPPPAGALDLHCGTRIHSLTSVELTPDGVWVDVVPNTRSVSGEVRVNGQAPSCANISVTAQGGCADNRFCRFGTGWLSGAPTLFQMDLPRGVYDFEVSLSGCDDGATGIYMPLGHVVVVP